MRNLNQLCSSYLALGLGTTVNYIVYIEEDIPKKIVLKPKGNAKGDEAFKFITELSVPAFYTSPNNNCWQIQDA